MKMAIWASGTPGHFLIYVCNMVHVIKQMGLNTKFQEAANAVEKLKIDWDISKDAHSKAKRTTRRRRMMTPLTQLS
jgi:hypothetical protein